MYLILIVSQLPPYGPTLSQLPRTWSDSKCAACGESAWALPLGTVAVMHWFCWCRSSFDKGSNPDSETTRDSETTVQKLRFRNYDSETIPDSETMVQKLSRFRNYGSETTLQKLRFRNYGSETTIQKLRFRNYEPGFFSFRIFLVSGPGVLVSEPGFLVSESRVLVSEPGVLVSEPGVLVSESGRHLWQSDTERVESPDTTGDFSSLLMLAVQTQT